MSAKKRKVNSGEESTLTDNRVTLFLKQIEDMAGAKGAGPVNELKTKPEIESYLSKFNTSDLEILCKNKPDDDYHGAFSSKEHSTKAARINLLVPWVYSELKKKKIKSNSNDKSAKKDEKIKILSELLAANEELELQNTAMDDSDSDASDMDDDAEELQNIELQIQLALKRKTELLKLQELHKKAKPDVKTPPGRHHPGTNDRLSVTTLHVTFTPHMTEADVASNLRLLIKKLPAMVSSGQPIPWSWCVPFIKKEGEDHGQGV